MKKIIIASGLLMLINTQMVQAQNKKDRFNNATSTQNTNTQNQNSNKNNSNSEQSNLSNTQVVSGLKEALRVSANNASSKLSVTDGFFKNAAIKILMPAEVQQVEKTLRNVGLGSIVDKAILSMNRAAEDATKQAAPIFIKAITSMSIQDGFDILTGNNNAATLYLERKTTQSLTTAFRPVVNKSLDKVGATALWKNVFNTYNKLPLITKKVNPDLSGYVVEKALNGMFYTIAQEELKIRKDPAAQVTNLLKQVFGRN
ncbi:MAG TPA: DUF4197 domain-containing protein [Edaphocola sp.]|nr:DUF4197 domain-containing protein [Edaphocola sp.]